MGEDSAMSKTDNLKCKGCGKHALGAEESKKTGICTQCRTNDEGGERGSCPKCGFLIDKCMSFNKEDTRGIICPSCKKETYQGAYYPKSFSKAVKEYQRSLQS